MLSSLLGFLVGVVCGGVIMFFVAKNNRDKFASSLDKDFAGIAAMLKAEVNEIDFSALKAKLNALKEKAKSGKE